MLETICAYNPYLTNNAANMFEINKEI
jgi:hypothetical protein